MNMYFFRLDQCLRMKYHDLLYGVQPSPLGHSHSMGLRSICCPGRRHTGSRIIQSAEHHT